MLPNENAPYRQDVVRKSQASEISDTKEQRLLSWGCSPYVCLGVAFVKSDGSHVRGGRADELCHAPQNLT